MNFFVKELKMMLDAVEKVMTAPRKVYDSDGNLLKEVQDNSLFDSWLDRACKSADFYGKVKQKYEMYFKRSSKNGK